MYDRGYEINGMSFGRNQIFLAFDNNSYVFPMGATLVASEVETNAAEDISDAVEWKATHSMRAIHLRIG